MPSNARMPAKPRPHAVGMKLANTTPNTLHPTQANQFTPQLPAR